MKIGAKIHAPEGWKSICKEIEYYFLNSDSNSRRVLLVFFENAEKKAIKASLVSVNQQTFEAGVKQNSILMCETQNTLPPWLEKFEGYDLSRIDDYRTGKPKVSHSTRVTERFKIITEAVTNSAEILKAKSPQEEISRYAQRCETSQNISRYTLWFLTYLIFGRNIWSLLPPFHNSGNWNRLKHPDTKFGAPSKSQGRNYGYGMSTDLAKRCVDSFANLAVLGKSMVSIYRESMVKYFNCHLSIQKNGMKILISKNESAFPTYDQFRYQVKKAYSQEQIQIKIYGEVRVRTKLSNSKGRFSEEISNLYERVEVDGYYTSDFPRGYVEGSTLPPLCVVVGRDLLSGSKLGIGFSFGRERSAAYRMMLFSMAIPKHAFCRYFGISLKENEWMSEGLPPHFTVDRGPGSSKDLIERLEKIIPIKDMSPSYSGQSKATVESSHPRDTSIEGQPTYVESGLTPVQLARREIRRLITFNESANMEDRIDPDSEMIDVTPSPNGLWKHYDQLYRNDAQPLSFDDAVRAFLSPVEFTVKEDGIYLLGRLYFSESLRESGLFDMPGVTKVSGYMMDMCTRYIWVDVSGRLIEVPAMLRIRGDSETLFTSIDELNDWNQNRKIVQSAFRLHAHAVHVDAQVRFEEDVGKDYEGGSRKKGRPVKNDKSRQETNEVIHSASTNLRRSRVA